MSFFVVVVVVVGWFSRLHQAVNIFYYPDMKCLCCAEDRHYVTSHQMCLDLLFNLFS